MRLRGVIDHWMRLKGRACWFMLCLVFAFPSTAFAAAPPDAAIAQLVVAIAGYTQFPVMPSPLRVCIVGTPLHASGLGDAVFQGRRTIDDTSPPTVGPLPCDVLYLGQFSGTEKTQFWIQRAAGKPVVTIAEDDPTCHSEEMFCLDYLPGRVSFRLNIDAITRSAVQIDPRVLRVSESP
jgi:hypothetical protein